MPMFGERVVNDPFKHDFSDNTMFGDKVYLAHHGIKGQRWGVRNGPPYPLKGHETDISPDIYAKINKLYRSMPLADRRMIDPDISEDDTEYFESLNAYKKRTAFNSVSEHGFIIGEKIPSDKNIDGTHGIEVGIGVTAKGKGVGTGLTADLVDWFDNQDEYDVIWWPVDNANKGSIRIAEKNGFVKDPLGNNYVYAKGQTFRDLGVCDRTPDDIYNKLNTFDYGCIINGKRYNETNLDEVDWSQYKTTPVKQFAKDKIGTCWDYTNYQHEQLKKAGINHDTHMLVMDTDSGPVTHTFTTYEDPVNHKQYWLEQALYSERGIHAINSYQDAIDVISKRYDSSGTKAFDVYKFNPDGMDQGLGDQEFFDRATSDDPIFQRK